MLGEKFHKMHNEEGHGYSRFPLVSEKIALSIQRSHSHLPSLLVRPFQFDFSSMDSSE